VLAVSVYFSSAMTSVTDSLSVSLSLAAQGARTATVAVKESLGSSEQIVVLVNNDLIDSDAKLLSSHIDGRYHIS